MKIAFTSSGKDLQSVIDPRFGRTAYIVLYSTDSESIEVFDNGSIQNEAHGAGTATAQQLFIMKPDVLITGNGPGETAAKVLKNSSVRIFVDAHELSLEQAYEQFQQGKLKEI